MWSPTFGPCVTEGEDAEVDVFSPLLTSISFIKTGEQEGCNLSHVPLFCENETLTGNNWEQPQRKTHTQTLRKYSAGHLKQNYQFRFGG